jgi:hypothetical protein
MADYCGDIIAGATISGTFNTRSTASAPITLAGSPTVRVYKRGSTTEDDSGVTLTVDLDGRTGLHEWVIDTSADGTFYAAGSNYYVVITAGTVDSVSVVGVCVGEFSIQNRNDYADTRKVMGSAAQIDGSGRQQVSVLAYNGNTLTSQGALNAATFWNSDGGNPGTLLEDLTAILADTAELQGDWVNGGRLDLILDTIAAAVDTEVGAIVTGQGTILTEVQKIPRSGTTYRFTNADTAGTDDVTISAAT